MENGIIDDYPFLDGHRRQVHSLHPLYGTLFLGKLFYINNIIYKLYMYSYILYSIIYTV